VSYVCSPPLFRSSDSTADVPTPLATVAVLLARHRCEFDLVQFVDAIRSVCRVLPSALAHQAADDAIADALHDALRKPGATLTSVRPLVLIDLSTVLGSTAEYAIDLEFALRPAMAASADLCTVMGVEHREICARFIHGTIHECEEGVRYEVRTPTLHRLDRGFERTFR
jgi:hypothetical protein